MQRADVHFLLCFSFNIKNTILRISALAPFKNRKQKTKQRSLFMEYYSIGALMVVLLMTLFSIETHFVKVESLRNKAVVKKQRR